MIIATRELDLANSEAKVMVHIGKPEKYPDSSDYYCPFRIAGLGKERANRAGGVDAVQALLLALKMVGAELYTSKEAKDGHLKWVGSSGDGDLGFPVPVGFWD